MQLSKRLSVSPDKLKELREMNSADLKSWISSKNLFGGYPKEYVQQQEAIIYGKIIDGRTKKTAPKTQQKDTPEGNGKDNTKGRGGRKKKKG